VFEQRGIEDQGADVKPMEIDDLMEGNGMDEVDFEKDARSFLEGL
jgi:hypothetical protein